MAKAELEQIEFVPLSQIQLQKPEQPRRYFDPEALEQLTKSIRQHGILQPLLVRPVSGVTARYGLVAGERRFRAAQAVGLNTVPVVVRQLSDIEAATLALVENLQRQDLNALEETEGILSLLALQLELTPEATISLLMRMAKEAKGQTAQNVLGQAEIETVISVFDSVGRMSWESFVTSRLPLLNLAHDLQQAIQTQALDYTKAIALSRVKDDTQRSILLQQVLEEDWSVRQIQAQIKKLRNAEQPKPSIGLSTTTADINIAAEDNSGESSEASEAGGAGTDETLNNERPTTFLEPETLELAALGTEHELAQTVPLSAVVEFEATTSSESSAGRESAPSLPSQQKLHALPYEEPLYGHLNVFNQIEILSRKLLYLVGRRRKPISDANKQSRLEALLVELNQILVEEW